MLRPSPVLVVVGLLFLTGPVRAEDRAEEPSRRRLGAHLFIAREGVADPFTESFVASSSGLSLGGAKGPTFDLNGNPISLEDYKILAYSQLFTGQWGLADFWAWRLRVLGAAYSGTNTSGVAGVGVNGVVRGSAGTTLGFTLADNLRLGFRIDVSWGPSVAINILDAIRRSIAAGDVQVPVVSTYSTVVTPTLSLAWTISRGVGGIFNVTYSNGVIDVNDTTNDADLVSFQAAFDVDLRELGSIPLGLSVDYSAGYATQAGRFRQYLLGLGFFYTGRPGLTLGLELGYHRSPLGTERTVFATSFSGLFVLRFAFN